MAAALTTTLVNADFQNWLKGSLAVLFARAGLVDFVSLEITEFQRDLLQIVYTQTCITAGTTCNVCTTANVLTCPTEGFCSKGKRCYAHDSRTPDKKPNQACPNGLCNAIRDAIRKAHRFNLPSWRNTDARRWCSDSFEISKCFMPLSGYSDKTCVADTDFNGILAIVFNNKRFQAKLSDNLSVEPNICTEARNIGREIRHSSEYLLSDQDLSKYTCDLITLLSDPLYLAADDKARDAVEKLNQLKLNTLSIHLDDITKVLTENIRETFRDQHNEVILAIQQHFNDKETATLEAIDSVIAQKMKTLDKHKDSVIHQMQVQPSGKIKGRLFSFRSSEKELKRDLITHYREHESKIPIAPLVENNDVPLKEFYVPLPMMAFDKPHPFLQGYAESKEGVSGCSTKSPVSSYRTLLHDSEHNPYRHIYISAQTGSGKTSFSKMLTITWCQAKSPEKLAMITLDTMT